jgi:hypothetical protein
LGLLIGKVINRQGLFVSYQSLEVYFQILLGLLVDKVVRYHVLFVNRLGIFVSRLGLEF